MLYLNFQGISSIENPRDLARLDQPQLALEAAGDSVVIDEVQRKPDLFPLLRYMVDKYPERRYLILGSASRDLLRQSSETLAGRIAYHELGGFSFNDVQTTERNARRLWLRGGFPAMDSWLISRIFRGLSGLATLWSGIT